MLKDQALLEPQEHKPVMRYLVNLVRCGPAVVGMFRTRCFNCVTPHRHHVTIRHFWPCLLVY
jgi:hypothetical protein